MAQGKTTVIPNIDRKFGADPEYVFLKTQAEGRGEAGEEYWLLTHEEVRTFTKRAATNPEDTSDFGRGIFGRIANSDPRPNANEHYIAVDVQTESGGDLVKWLLTEYELERIRVRVEKNNEDIEANRESWLADLFD